MVSWIGISEDSGTFVSSRQAQTVSSGVFSSLESELGMFRSFLCSQGHMLLEQIHCIPEPLSKSSTEPVQPPCVQQNTSLTWNDTAGSAGTYREGVGLGVTFLTWHANISSPAPGVYVQPVVLHGFSCSSRLCPRTGGNWDSWNARRFAYCLCAFELDTLGDLVKTTKPLSVVYASWERGPFTGLWWDCKEKLGGRQFMCENP